MKILLSTPPVHYLQSYSFKYPRFPWLSLPVLAATVRKNHQVKLVSHTHLRRRPHTLFEDIDSFQPNLLVFAVPAPLSAVALEEHLPDIKQRHPHLKIVCGGQFPSFAPEFLLKAGCDIVCVGEADQTFPALVEALENESSISGMAGIATMQDGKLVLGSVASKIEKLDDLPLPAIDLWPRSNRTIYKKNVGGTIECARGCPFHCSFCTLQTFHETFREKSTEHILEELKQQKSLGQREIMIVDGTFGANPSHARDLALGILKNGLDLEMIAFMRAQTATENPDLIELLARAGLKMAIIGFESYSDQGLAKMNKSSSLQANLAAASIYRQNGIFVVGSHFYGFPGDSYRTAIATFRQGIKTSDHYMAGLFTPLPGTHTYQKLKDAGRLRSENPHKINFTEYLIKGGPQPKRFQLFTAILYLIYYLGPSRWISAVAGKGEARRVFRSEYRLFFWRLFYSLLRKIKVKIL